MADLFLLKRKLTIGQQRHLLKFVKESIADTAKRFSGHLQHVSKISADWTSGRLYLNPKGPGTFARCIEL